MKKSLTPSVSFLILFPIEKGLRMKQVRLIQIQNPNYEILFKTLIMKSYLSRLTPRNALLDRERSAFTSSSAEWLRRGKVLCKVIRGADPGSRSGGDRVGPVAQRIRARGYEPRCRGFESLLAHNRLIRGRIFTFRGTKIMT